MKFSYSSAALFAFLVTTLLSSVVGTEPCSQYSEKIESPCNEVLTRKHGYEIRKYSSGNDTSYFTSAYVASSCFGVAAKQGFDKNFAYISGKNSKNETIPMTAPVIFSRDKSTDGWLVGFFVPSKYAKRAQIPNPKDSSVSIIPLPKDITIAVIRFGGFAGPNDFKENQHKLQTKLRADGVKTVDDEWDVVWASYDSPFQLFNRNNEVWLHVEAPSNSTATDFMDDVDEPVTFDNAELLIEQRV